MCEILVVEREQHIYKTMAHRQCNFPLVDKEAYDNDLVVFLYVNRSLSFFSFLFGCKDEGQSPPSVPSLSQSSSSEIRFI